MTTSTPAAETTMTTSAPASTAAMGDEMCIASGFMMCRRTVAARMMRHAVLAIIRSAMT